MTKYTKLLITPLLITSIILIIKTINYANTPFKQGQISINIGKTQIKRQISRFRNTTKGQLVREGDTIKTYHNGFIEIILFNNKRFKIYNDSLILIKKITQTHIDIFLFNGTISINEKLNKNFTYNIKSNFFSILSTPKTINKTKNNTTITDEKTKYSQTINENNNQIIQKETKLYIEYKQKLANITLLKGNILILKNKKTLNLIAPASVSLTENIPLSKLQNNYEENRIDEYIENINDSFDYSNPIEEYQPLYKTKITDEETFYKKRKKEIDKKAIIKKYRTKKQIYYKINFGAFNWIENKFYLSIGFYPEFHISTFTMRLRLLLFIPYTNPENINAYYNIHEWYFKKLPDYFNKIDIIQYTNKDETFYIRLAELQKKTLGYGLTLQNYSNTILLPHKRRLALDFGLNFPVIDIEGFIADISNFNIMGFRIASRPFIEQNENEFSAHYSLAINFSMDLAPNNTSTNPAIYLGSIDVNIPILRNIHSDYQLSIYAELAIQGYEFNNQNSANKYGEKVNNLKFTDNFGLTTGINGTLFKRLIYNIHYKYLQEGFIPEYIDSFYEIERENKMKLLLTKNKDDAHGILIGLGANFPQYIYIYTEFYYETNNLTNINKTNNRFKLEIISSPKLSHIFYGKLIYQRKNIQSFTNFFLNITDNSIIQFETNSTITKWLDIQAGYKHFAKQKNNYFIFNNFVYINFLFIL